MKKLLLILLLLLFTTNCFGAFPTTGILDTFDRANEGPPPSASWTTPAGVNGFEVLSNQCTPDSVALGYAGALWNPTTYGLDCEEYITVITKPASGQVIDLILGDASGNGYGIDYYVQAGTDYIDISKFTGWSGSKLGASISQEVTNGDSIGVSIIWGGATNTITLWYKSGAGAWTNIGERTDATYNTARNLTIWSSATATVLDNFGGGTVVAAAVNTLLTNCSLTNAGLRAQ